MAKKNKYAPMQECKQALIFARVSSREQEQGASTDAQLKIMRDYCKKNSLRIIKTYNLTESSTRGERKKFWEMIKFVKSQRRKTAIIVHCVDRLQRGYKECSEVEDLLKDDIMEIHFLKEGLTLHKESSSSDIMRYDMGVLAAKMYINSMKDNVKRSLEFNVQQGKWQSFAPIGYKNIRDIDNKAAIVVDEERAEKVIRLFELYATGLHSLKTLHTLSKEMNLCSRQKKNPKPLTRANIHNILQNPFYYGVMLHKNRLIPHIYPPLIDKLLFDRVQNILNGTGKPKTTKGYNEIPFALNGLIRCKTCGCAISSEKHTKKNTGKEYTYLRCSHLKKDCKQGIVNENIIFEQLENEILSHLSIPENILTQLKARVKEHISKELNLNASVKRNFTNNMEKLKERQVRLFDFYLDGNIDKLAYEAKKSELEIEMSELQNSIDKVSDINSNILSTIDNLIDIAGNSLKIFQKSTPHNKRRLLGLILKSCYLENKTITYDLQKPFDVLCGQNDDLKFDIDSLIEISNISRDIDSYHRAIKYQ